MTGADLAVSLLPSPVHPKVAEAALRAGTDLVTTSYVSPALEALDGAARARGVLLMNEIGLDPGIDHMSALRAIRRTRERGGEGRRLPERVRRPPRPGESPDESVVVRVLGEPARRAHGGAQPGPLARGRDDRRGRSRAPLLRDRAVPGRGARSLRDLPESRLGRLRPEVRPPGRARHDARNRPLGSPGETLGAVVRLGLLDPEPRVWPPGTTWAAETRSSSPRRRATFGRGWPRDWASFPITRSSTASRGPGSSPKSRSTPARAPRSTRPARDGRKGSPTLPGSATW
jgi:hypothetical protein